jgi:hypothetical protein
MLARGPGKDKRGEGEAMGKNWRVSAALSGAAAAWLIYDMATATEYPSRALAILQWVLLTLAVIGLVGSLVKFAAEK